MEQFIFENLTDFSPSLTKDLQIDSIATSIIIKEDLREYIPKQTIFNSIDAIRQKKYIKGFLKKFRFSNS